MQTCVICVLFSYQPQNALELGRCYTQTLRTHGSFKMKITGFYQDEVGEWVATLSCGHQRHVRHKPPLTNYPWVMTKEGRQRYIGVEVACRLCKEEVLQQRENESS